MKKTNIFLSYCWADSDTADEIYEYFKSKQNIELHRDKIDIRKWGSIKEYMQSISDMDYTILLISETYLKSSNCMYEVLEVMQDRNYKDKIFPAVIYSKIYNPITRAEYVKYWQDEFRKLKNALKGIDAQNLGKLPEDLKQRQDISSNIADFLDLISDMNNPDIEDVCVRIEEKLNLNGSFKNRRIDDTAEPDKKQIKQLVGWCYIDQQFIDKREQPSEYEILKYFDGKEPSYNDIFSSFIPKREIVNTITAEFRRCNNDNQTKCVLLTGAGGEGKTTVLLQTVRELTEQEHWHALVLRHSNKNMDLQDDVILKLIEKGSWIICVDNCFPISGKLFNLLVSLSQRKEKNVHLLLCARDIDWRNSKSGEHAWRQYSDYTDYKLRGIDEGDAGKIVAAWSTFGKKGLGELHNLSIADAKEKLYLSSKSEKDKNESDEGALLGAMLTTRHGEGLKTHVREMLLRLQEIPIGVGSLLDAFAYIVAMHSKKLYFLSKPVMAQLYNFELKDVKKYILTPLGDEAATAVSGDLIYTRHILIAQTARIILDQEFGYDFDEMYNDLVIAAMEVTHNNVHFIQGFREWKYLGDNFMEENPALAIRLCQSVLKVEPGDPRMTVHLSSLFRELSEYDRALALFRDVEDAVDHRPFFSEWAIVEANADNKHTSVCLSALAMSDYVAKQPLDAHNACINLYAIAVTFHELYSRFKNDDYLRASLAAIKMGEKIDADDKDIQKFIKRTLPKFNKKIVNEKLEYDKCLLKGIATAAESAELNFKMRLPSIDSLKFKKLFVMAGITES